MIKMEEMCQRCNTIMTIRYPTGCFICKKCHNIVMNTDCRKGCHWQFREGSMSCPSYYKYVHENDCVNLYNEDVLNGKIIFQEDIIAECDKLMVVYDMIRKVNDSFNIKTLGFYIFGSSLFNKGISHDVDILIRIDKFPLLLKKYYGALSNKFNFINGLSIKSVWLDIHISDDVKDYNVTSLTESVVWNGCGDKLDYHIDISKMLSLDEFRKLVDKRRVLKQDVINDGRMLV